MLDIHPYVIALVRGAGPFHIQDYSSAQELLASSTVDETLAARRALTGCKALYIEYIKYLSVVERLIRSLGNTRFCWITPGLTAGQGVENHCIAPLFYFFCLLDQIVLRFEPGRSRPHIMPETVHPICCCSVHGCHCKANKVTKRSRQSSHMQTPYSPTSCA